MELPGLLQTTGNNDLLTPEPLLAIVRAIVGDPIPLDVCAPPWNPTDAAFRLALPTHDGLAEPWMAAGWFCNPPFGAARKGAPSQCYAWAAKAREEARLGRWGVMLLPCDTGRQSTRAWHEHVLCDEMALYCVLSGRTRFDRAVGRERVVGGAGRAPTYSTGLYLYGIDGPGAPNIWRRFAAACAPHGAVLAGPRLTPTCSGR